MAEESDTAGRTSSSSSKSHRPMNARNLFFYIERKRIVGGIDHQPLSITQEDLQRISNEIKLKSRDEMKRERASNTDLSARELASKVSRSWKNLDQSTRRMFEIQALRDKQAFENAMSQWEIGHSREQQQEYEDHISLSSGAIVENSGRVNFTSELERLRQLREEHEFRMRRGLIQEVAFTEATSLPTTNPVDLLLQPLDHVPDARRSREVSQSRANNSDDETDYSNYSTDRSEGNDGGDSNESARAATKTSSLKNLDLQNRVLAVLDCEIQTLTIHSDSGDHNNEE